MQSRFLKQLIYGVFYLAIIFGVGYLLYAPFKSPASCFDNRKNQGETEVDCGGPCPSCELKKLKPMQVSPVSIFPLGEEQLSALFELKNLNVNYGAERFIYRLSFYDSTGKEIFSVSKSSFIYPGELKYIAEPGLEFDTRQVVRAEAQISNLSWRTISEFSLPKTQTRDIRVEQADENGSVAVSGLLVNQNSFALSRAVVIVIVKNQTGSDIGVSKTLVESIAPFEERGFTVNVPAAGMVQPHKDFIKIAVESSR